MLVCVCSAALDAAVQRETLHVQWVETLPLPE